MAKTKVESPPEMQTPAAAAAAASSPVRLRYIGPADAESPRYGALVPGRSYDEPDPTFAAYLVERHPDHWTRA